MRIKIFYLIATIAIPVFMFAGCGGDGGTTPVSGVSRGVITQMGSVFVNGVEFSTTNATITMEDPTETHGLKVGMVVTVTGSFDDGTHGTASKVEYADNLRGPVSTVDTRNHTMTVLDQNITYDPVKTVFNNFSGTGANGVAPGQMVEVSGFNAANGTVQATYIERRLPNWTPSTTVELKGAITSMPTTTTFTINSLTIDHTGITLPDGTTVGSFVKVEGTIPALTGTTLHATMIGSHTEGPQASEGERVEISGLVSNLSGTTFTVNGTTVNAGTLSLAGVANGVKVEVEGTLKNGVLMASKITVETEAPPTTLPAAPTAVTATAGFNQVTVAWGAVSGATSYNIYWSTTSGVTPATGTKISDVVSPYIQTGLTAGTAYYYVVTAVNSIGEGPPSAQVSATPTSVPTVPVAPIGVGAVGGANQVTVSWAAVSGATSYNIYWSTTTGVTTATGTKIAGVTSPYVQTGLTASTTYYYIVTAVNAAGESAPSVQVSATTSAPPPTVPPAPTGVTATGGTNSVTLAWPTVTGATSYNLYWSTTTGVTTANGTKITGVTSPYLHSRLTATPTWLAANTPYFYILTAVNAVGESTPSAQATATTSATDGVALYGSNCAGCHNPLATSVKQGRTAAQIQAAIDSNTGGMGSLSGLTPTQVQAIADVLAIGF